MKVLEKRSKRTLAFPGCYAFDAEMKLEEDQGEITFLHANYYNGEHFSVGNGSIFNDMTQNTKEPKPGVGIFEQYESLKEAEKSKYYDYFCQLDKMVKGMIDEKHRKAD